MQTNNLPTWERILAQRGILGAAKEFGWEPYEAGWRYPLWDTDGNKLEVTRWKAFDSGANPKYLWEPKGTPRPTYYLLPGALEAIKATSSVIIASGEPDSLTLRSAGAKNVLCWFGEKNVPATLAADLKAWGVISVENYPDLDPAGMDTAVKIQTMLLDSHSSFMACKLPGAPGSKFDLNKLWIVCDYNPDKFWDAIANTPVIDIELPPKSNVAKLPMQSAGGELPDDFFAAIARALNVTEYKTDGWSKPVLCPLHQDTNPSAGWHATKHILHCFVCHADGEHALAIEVGEKLNLRWRDYLPQQPIKVSERPKPRPVGKPADTFSWAEATQKVIDELTGNGPLMPEALPIRWKNLQRFGGLAKLAQRGKMIAIVADSGAGKTSFIETQVDDWRGLGYSGVLWGSEWSHQEYVYRAIQRQGGPSLMQMIEHNSYKAAKARNVADKYNPGKELPPPELQRAIAIAKSMLDWTGKLYFVEKGGITVETLVERMAAVHDQCVAAGERMAFAVLDYAQLIGVASGNSDSERVGRALAKFKEFVIDRQLVGIVGSQITKEAGREVAGGAKATQHNAQNLRGDYFNLILTINRPTDDQGVMSPTAAVRVSKNSLGQNGTTKLFLKTDQMVWHDQDLNKTNNLNDILNQHLDRKVIESAAIPF